MMLTSSRLSIRALVVVSLACAIVTGRAFAAGKGCNAADTPAWAVYAVGFGCLCLVVALFRALAQRAIPEVVGVILVVLVWGCVFLVGGLDAASCSR